MNNKKYRCAVTGEILTHDGWIKGHMEHANVIRENYSLGRAEAKAAITEYIKHGFLMPVEGD